MDQQFRKAEYLRGKIEMLKARKQDLLGKASALEIDSAARDRLAEALDEVIARLRKYTAELAELEPERRLSLRRIVGPPVPLPEEQRLYIAGPLLFHDSPSGGKKDSSDSD